MSYLALFIEDLEKEVAKFAEAETKTRKLAEGHPDHFALLDQAQSLQCHVKARRSVLDVARRYLCEEQKEEGAAA